MTTNPPATSVHNITNTTLPDMPAPVEEEPRSPGHHIELVDDNPSPRHDGEPSPGLRDSKGWDGKLRVPKSAVLANPEALSDPEYSDDDNVIPGEEVAADEGKG
jgi:protein phosphatase 1 regulatory subunit 7